MSPVPAAPRLIERPLDEAAIAKVLRQALPRHTGPDALLDALLHVAARYGQILTACVNAAPALHIDALGRELGTRPQPPVAARTHLVFKPATGAAGAPVGVPMRTRVAAPPPPGEPEPVIFETLADLDVVRADLVRAVLLDAGHRHAIDALAAGPSVAEDVPAAFHIAQEAAFGTPGLKQIVLRIELDPAAAPSPDARLEWGIAGAAGFEALVVERDGTQALARSGEIVLAPPPGAWPRAVRGGHLSAWLSCRAHGQPPVRVRSLLIDVFAEREVPAFEQVSNDSMALDTSKDFAPFGERAQFGSCWLLQSAAFAEPGAEIEIAVAMTNPEGLADAPLPAVSHHGHPLLRWEIFTAAGYQPLAVSDGTAALTRDGSLRFTVPPGVVPLQVGAVKAPCVRACLAGGRYLTAAADGGPGPAAYPMVRSLWARSVLRRQGLPPERVVSQAALQARALAIDRGFELFAAPDVAGPALYLGFDGPDTRVVAPRRLALFVQPATLPVPLVWADRPPDAPPVRWQARGPQGWLDVPVRDGGAGFEKPGLISIDVPDMAARWAGVDPELGDQLLWLRACWPPQGLVSAPAMIAINAVPAEQTERLRDEILGSGNGRPNQRLQVLRTPVIGDAVLQIREPDASWVRWRETEALAQAGPSDRVYALDRIEGHVTFGDGAHGRIPPTGPNNIRLASYTSGGGRRGNVPALALSQLRTTLPGVASVFNPMPATGGADTIAAADRCADAWAWLRHRERAVGPDDYADLARRASPDVVRAFCVPDPDRDPGAVTLTVMCGGAEPRPQPTLEMLGAVKAYIDKRRPPAVRLVVMGPVYAPVHVRARIRMEADASGLEAVAACRRRVEAFLHPVSGADGSGWAPGRRPHRSDFHALLGVVPGVAAVAGLSFQVDAPGSGPFIVAAGEIVVDVEREVLA